MKKLFAIVCFAATTFIGTHSIQAQSYKTGAGIMIDFGNGGTYAGPQLKHFFKKNHAGEFSAIFGNNVTVIQANYQYHQSISGAKGLQWYVGMGPGIITGKGSTNFAPSAMIGMDFKIPGAPLSISMDWRPRFIIGEYSDAEAGRFAAGFKFTF